MHNLVAVLENDTHKLLYDFEMQTDHLISARRPDLIVINKNKRTCKIVDIAVLADHRIKLTKSEKKDKNPDFAWELKKKTMEHEGDDYTIVIGSLSTVTKGLLKGLVDLEVGGQVETIKTGTFLRTARILRRLLETWGDLLSLKLQWEIIS